MIVFLALFFSCEINKKKSSLVDNLDLESWNESTVNFALIDCKLNDVDYLSKDRIQMIDKNNNLVTVRDDLDNILKSRREIINILKSNSIFNDISFLKLSENYHYKGKPSFYFRKNDNYYSCIYKDEEYIIKEEKYFDEDVFKFTNNSQCVIDLKVRIEDMAIISNLTIKDGEIDYNPESLFIKGD